MKEDLCASKVFKHDGATLTVYQVKTTKNVLLRSTMYSTDVTDDSQKSNPESVEFYNFTKCGVIKWLESSL